jgi:hypothetical protein
VSDVLSTGIAVRNRPHRTLHRADIVVGDRVRGVVQETLHELVDSIREIGLLYPLLVDETFTLIDGEQRLAALDVLGETDIPVIIDASVTGAGSEQDVLVERLRRELASNGVRTQFTPVQAAAARRRLRELMAKAKHTRTGVPLEERRKNWSSELATAETGVSRTTMDRVDKIVRIAEDDAQPMPVRREAAEGLTRIDSEGAAVDRVLKEVELAASAAAAVARYPDLEAIPGPAARVNMAAHLDSMPQPAREAQMETMRKLWSHSADVLNAYQKLRDTSRIGELIDLGNEALAAVNVLQSSENLTTELRDNWEAIADRLGDLSSSLRSALTTRKS